MNFWITCFCFYMLFINLAGIFLMGLDKRRAQKKAFRISEKQLFLCAGLGGCFGCLAGMYVFRHKTRHWYFQFGMPGICVLWSAVLILLIVKGILP